MINWKRFSVAGALGLVLCLLAWAPVDAQPKPATAQVTRATGRVEVLKKGQAQWNAIGVGAQLVEGDQVRAGSGASADLALPDGSTILVAENSRFVVTKLDYDSQTRERLMTFHLVVGKIKSEVVRAAVQVVRARQSNFLISTPSGVAAVRGTVTVTAYNPATGQTFFAVFPSPGQAPGSAIGIFVPLGVPGAAPITLVGGQFTTQVGNNPPAPVQGVSALPPAILQALLTAANAATANSPALTVVNVEIPDLGILLEPPPPVTAVTTPPPPPPPAQPPTQ